MKRSLIALCLVVFFSIPVSAQNCNKYYPMVEGATFEYTNYNKKGKTEGVSNYIVTDVTTSGDVTSATMSIDLKDEKGKDIYEMDYNFTCSGNMITVDYESLIPSSTLQQFDDMEMDISGTDLEFPNDLSVGLEMPDANVTIKISMGGMNMNTTVDMVNRTVEKQESIETPAGTFDCYVVSSENLIKAMTVKQSFSQRVWFAEDVGMIKQESYKKNGDLLSSTILTNYSK